ncbi:sigma-54-dependent Fis family transcriptional regulator [Bacillus massiliigorillae]|uniref:sigma-54-dependent Fis family transcriptional regulator n=1 Tax=Bacillus massiliigorillae TaxID=1243664 RepID=UPI0003A1A0E0|nr:sigma-54-dependent Fis family transcriptional regulator [Bacillus massiliigorillae]
MVEFRKKVSRFQRQISEETTFEEAAALLLGQKFTLLPVTNKEGILQGVFTRRNMHQMIMDEVKLTTPIRKYIKNHVITINIETPFDEIVELAKTSEVGTAVVVDEDNRVIGLFSKTDMVLSLFESTNFLKEQLETIIQHAHIGVIMTDEQLHITYVNDLLHRMSGKNANQMLGNQLHYVFPEFKAPLQSSQNYMSITLRNSKAIAFLSPYQRNAMEKGFIVLFQETPELERMAEELETVKSLKTTLQTTLNHAYDGIITIDEKRIVQMVSPSLLQLFRLQEKDVLGKVVSKVLPELQLAHVFETQEADFSDFEEEQGIKYIVHRIPIIHDGKVIGAIGKVMFRQLNEVGQLFKKWQKAERKADYYHKQYKQTETAKYTWDQIYSVDTQMDKLKKSGKKAAKGRSTVLIRGESGTGKELFAHAIHSSSARRDDRFVIVNCAAIPEDLLESEFFGYEEGAFTGARQRGKIGKFDLANGGTLFLDEIGDMSLTLQAKLLRVLQDREFYRVGGTAKIQVDVRIIAATNRDLEQMVKDGLFREDLYYRLNVISLHVPPLRERKADIEHLIVHIMEELNRVLETSITGFDQEAKKTMLSYHWPGNVRELKNVLERAMTFAEHGSIQIEDLPEYMLKQIERKQLEQPDTTMFEDAEINAIKKALKQTKGNKAEAARLLGISRSSLYEKLKKYQLTNAGVL